jgi:uncharacterized protein HemY
MKAEIARALRANRNAQAAVRRLLLDEPGPQTQALLLAQAACSLAESFEALVEIQSAEIERALRANRNAQAAVRRLLRDEPGPQTQALLLAQAASSLAESFEALVEIQSVVDSKKTMESAEAGQFTTQRKARR